MNTNTQIHSQSSEKTIYFTNLDGLRFFAFLIVFISHATLFLGYMDSSRTFSFFRTYILANGDTGVAFFFVLSGFLITHLLLREKENTGDISLKKFYIRRILRIWPVYFLTLFVGFFVLPEFLHYFLPGKELPFLVYPSYSALPPYLFFLANFKMAFSGGASVPTDVLWSISVEEQFYLIWPLVVSLIPSKYLFKFLSFVVLVSCVYRYVYALYPDVLAYSTLSVMSDLAVGCMLGLLVYKRSYIIERLRKAPRFVIGLVYAIIPLFIFGRHYMFDITASHVLARSFFMAIYPLLLSLVYAFVIFEQNESLKSFFKLGKSSALSFLGKISYGFYSYHMFAFTIVLFVASKFGAKLQYVEASQWLLFAGASLLTTFFLAVVSYYFMETWFLRKKPIV